MSKSRPDFLILCPYCNSTYLTPAAPAPPGDPYKRPSFNNPALYYVRCSTCPGRPTLVVPAAPPGGKYMPVRVTRRALCPPGTLPGAWVFRPELPVPPRPPSSPKTRPVEFLTSSYRLRFPEKWARPGDLGRFPVVTVIEQLGFLVRLGLDLTTAVMAALASEWSYVARLPPGTGQLEALLGLMCSVVMPIAARPAGPAWLYTVSGSEIREGCVSLATHRQRYLWARAREYVVDPPAETKNDLLARYRMLALPFHGIAPSVVANLRVLRLADYALRYGFVRFVSRGIGLLCWDTCTSGLRVDEAEHRRWHDAMEGIYGRQLEL